MSTEIISEILAKADLLNSDEQRQLIALLAEKARYSTDTSSKSKVKWSELAGILPSSGQDAQEYISQIRRGANAQRNLR